VFLSPTAGAINLGSVLDELNFAKKKIEKKSKFFLAYGMLICVKAMRIAFILDKKFPASKYFAF
jgi:hypothetical protein